MAFYHRKFILNKPDKKYASSCYICYVCPQECYLKSPPPPPPLSQTSQSKNHQTSLILILMLFVLGTVFLFLSYLTIAKYRSRRRNSEPFENNNYADQNHVSVLDHPIWYIRTVGLPQSSIDSIPILKYKKGKCSIESTDCWVCLSEFHENESLKLLPKCSHAFHVPCIDPWLSSHKNCPVCRAPVLIQGPNNSEENEMGTRPEEVQTRGEASSENHLSISELNLDPKNNKFRVFSDLADRSRLKLEKPVRRCVSMDFSSCASMIFCTKKDQAGCSDQ